MLDESDNGDIEDDAEIMEYAIRFHDLNVLRLILQAGADPTAVHDSERDSEETFVGLASRRRDAAVMECLIDWGIDIDAPCRRDGQTPLHVAAMSGKPDIVKLLINHGANIHARDANGDTPLHEAASGGCPQCIRILLDAGAELEARGLGESTPLTRAAFTRSPEAVRTLLDAGADVNAMTHHGITALMWACRMNPQGAMLLLDHGARIDLLDNEGQSALHWAAASGRSDDVAVRLIRAGLSTALKSEEGLTPEILALRCGHPQTANVIADAEAQRQSEAH